MDGGPDVTIVRHGATVHLAVHLDARALQALLANHPDEKNFSTLPLLVPRDVLADVLATEGRLRTGWPLRSDDAQAPRRKRPKVRPHLSVVRP